MCPSLSFFVTMSEFFRPCPISKEEFFPPCRNFSLHVGIFPNSHPICWEKSPPCWWKGSPVYLMQKKRWGWQYKYSSNCWGNHPSYVRPYSARVQKHFPFFTVYHQRNLPWTRFSWNNYFFLGDNPKNRPDVKKIYMCAKVKCSIWPTHRPTMITYFNKVATSLYFGRYFRGWL